MGKVFEPVDFARTILTYNMLPNVLIVPFAIVLPWIECVVGLCLITGFWIRPNALISLLLLVSFSLALGVNILRGADMSCGCFGVGGGGVSLPIALFVDLCLLVFSGLLIFARQAPFSLDRFWGRIVSIQTE